MNINIKPQYKKTVIAFGNNGLVLGERTQAELLEIAVLARRSGDTSIISMFEKLPPLAELLEAKTNKELSVLNISKPGTPKQLVEVPKSFTGTDPKELPK